MSHLDCLSLNLKQHCCQNLPFLEFPSSFKLFCGLLSDNEAVKVWIINTA